jgi:hypothetical protein
MRKRRFDGGSVPSDARLPLWEFSVFGLARRAKKLAGRAGCYSAVDIASP